MRMIGSELFNRDIYVIFTIPSVVSYSYVYYSTVPGHVYYHPGTCLSSIDNVLVLGP